jgi:4-diphosphocytidyl-2-C-methyl-D-erythritol kinase
MTALHETARAKLNLTLEVLGRRGDGYHELRSLVAFARVGDSVELEPEGDLALTVEGPFRGALAGGNLVTAAAEAARAKRPAITLGQFRLIKMLPVAAGLGGGSADAAATLRLLARANPGALDGDDLRELAASLGSDVTVCLDSHPALMTGRGEMVTATQGLPACGVVFANPGWPLASASVYGALNAPPFPPSPPRAGDAPDFAQSFERLIDYASARGNDLEGAALKLVPIIGEVLEALRGAAGVRLVRVSGSGPTCFALFASADKAKAAADPLAASHPTWWVTASEIGSS